MRNRVSASLSGKLAPAAAVILLAGLSAACSDSVRLKEPLFTGSTANQRAIIGSQSTQQDMPPAVASYSSEVNRAPLPPPPSTMASAGPGPVDGPFAWSAVGGTVVTVGPGETLADLTVKYGVPAEQILSANQLRRASDVTPGRVVVIPRRVPVTPEGASRQQQQPYMAPVASSQPAPKALTPAPVVQPQPQAAPRTVAASTDATTHVVQPGDTLYSIARRYGARVNDLVAYNGLNSASEIRVGQRIALKPGTASGTASTSRFASAQPVPQKLQQPTQVAAVDTGTRTDAAPTGATKHTVEAPRLPATTTTPVQVGKDESTRIAAIDEAAAAASTDGTSFRWPVRGRIISSFGAKNGGERNDGINLAVPEGTSVKAAEAGTVIYAGNELEGYGQLVLIRHADGWVSAYAHNKELRVKRGDKVRRGETVALAGMSGSVTAPQVHFELRRGAKPVNPLDYLGS